MHTDLSTGYDFASRKMQLVDSSIARQYNISRQVLEVWKKGACSVLHYIAWKITLEDFEPAD
jgi:hypothetical protein